MCDGFRLTVAVMMGTIILRSFLGWAPENKALTLLYTLNGVFAVWNLLFFLELIPGENPDQSSDFCSCVPATKTHVS